MMRALLRAVAAAATGIILLGSPPAGASPIAPAEAIGVLGSGLGGDDAARLGRGETVTREQTIDAGERRYVGGITYTLVDTPPEELGALLEDVRTYRQVLPRTKQARLVGENGPDFFVELRQGNSLVEAKYTLRARK